MKKHRAIKSKGLKFTVIVLIVIGLFFLRGDSLSNLISKITSLSVKEMSLEYRKQVKLEDGGRANIYNDKILNWNGQSLEIFSLDGILLEKKDIEFENPNMVFGKEKLYLINKSQGDIYILDENLEIGEKIEGHKGIFNLKEEGKAMIVHSKSQDREEIIFMDFMGGELFRNVELKNILTYSIDENNSRYLVSNFNMGDAMESKVNIYNMDGKLENTMSFPGEIILFTEFIEKGNLLLSNLSLYATDGVEIIWEKSIPFIKDIKVVDREIYVLYDNNLDIMNFQGEIKEKFVFSKEYNKIFVSKNLGILYGSHDVLGIKSGEKIFEYEIKDEIQNLYGYGDLIGIRIDDRIDLYNLKNKK